MSILKYDLVILMLIFFSLPDDTEDILKVLRKWRKDYTRPEHSDLTVTHIYVNALLTNNGWFPLFNAQVSKCNAIMVLLSFDPKLHFVMFFISPYGMQDNHKIRT